MLYSLNRLYSLRSYRESSYFYGGRGSRAGHPGSGVSPGFLKRPLTKIKIGEIYALRGGTDAARELVHELAEFLIARYLRVYRATRRGGEIVRVAVEVLP